MKRRGSQHQNSPTSHLNPINPVTYGLAFSELLYCNLNNFSQQQYTGYVWCQIRRICPFFFRVWDTSVFSVLLQYLPLKGNKKLVLEIGSPRKQLVLCQEAKVIFEDKYNKQHQLFIGLWVIVRRCPGNNNWLVDANQWVTEVDEWYANPLIRAICQF